MRLWVIAIARCGFGLPNLPATMGPESVIPPDVGSEVVDSGLAGRATPIQTQIGNRMVNIDAATDPGGVWEHIGRVA